ncbi:hypothetical protein FOA43_001139 [Brettanomyces nanus]|uniref:Stress response protein NST1 n=1 Tax=Eeniella nana TaxID=13502 RepID=A0A875S3D7_EENNA|nr:uncharacterized protein FOA43_001139 [Brettanomyces nanus]QPG73824.1 hypothetical protein FOA43_001139 [Brettanomyces nanus]
MSTYIAGDDVHFDYAKPEDVCNHSKSRAKESARGSSPSVRNNRANSNGGVRKSTGLKLQMKLKSPDAEYPTSRVIRQGTNGDVIVSELKQEVENPQVRQSGNHGDISSETINDVDVETYSTDEYEYDQGEDIDDRETYDDDDDDDDDDYDNQNSQQNDRYCNCNNHKHGSHQHGYQESHTDSWELECQKQIILSQLRHPPQGNYLWDCDISEGEKEKIKQFWLKLSEDRKREIVDVSNDDVMKMIHEEQQLSCDCKFCGNRKLILEKELEKLYREYYTLQKLVQKDTDEYQLNERLVSTFLGIKVPETVSEEEEEEEEEEEQEQGQEQEEEQEQEQGQELEEEQEQDKDKDFETMPNDGKNGTKSHFDEVLSLAGDIIKNDGKNFIHMIEKLDKTHDGHLDKTIDGDMNKLGYERYKAMLAAYPKHFTKKQEEEARKNFELYMEMSKKGHMRLPFMPGMKETARGKPDEEVEGEYLDDNEEDEDQDEKNSNRDEEEEEKKNNAELDVEDNKFYDEDGDENAREDDEESQYTDENDYDSEYYEREEEIRRRLVETNRLLQMSTSKLLRANVLQAYKEKVAEDSRKQLLEELETEERIKKEKEEKERRKKERQKEKKRLQQVAREEEKKRKEVEKSEKERQQKEEQKRKAEDGRKRKEAERKKREEEQKKKREEKQKRKEVELERLQKEKEERERLHGEEEEKKLAKAEAKAKAKVRAEAKAIAKAKMEANSKVRTKTKVGIEAESNSESKAKIGQIRQTKISSSPLMPLQQPLPPMLPSQGAQADCRFTGSRIVRNSSSGPAALPPLTNVLGVSSLSDSFTANISGISTAGTNSNNSSSWKLSNADIQDPYERSALPELGLPLPGSDIDLLSQYLSRASVGETGSTNLLSRPFAELSPATAAINTAATTAATATTGHPAPTLTQPFFNTNSSPEKDIWSSNTSNTGTPMGSNAALSTPHNNSIWGLAPSTTTTDSPSPWLSTGAGLGSFDRVTMFDARKVQLEVLKASPNLPMEKNAFYSVPLLYHYTKSSLSAVLPNLTLLQFLQALSFPLGDVISYSFELVKDDLGNANLVKIVKQGQQPTPLLPIQQLQATQSTQPTQFGQFSQLGQLGQAGQSGLAQPFGDSGLFMDNSFSQFGKPGMSPDTGFLNNTWGTGLH